MKGHRRTKSLDTKNSPTETKQSEDELTSHGKKTAMAHLKQGILEVKHKIEDRNIKHGLRKHQIKKRGFDRNVAELPPIVHETCDFLEARGNYSIH